MPNQILQFPEDFLTLANSTVREALEVCSKFSELASSLDEGQLASLCSRAACATFESEDRVVNSLPIRERSVFYSLLANATMMSVSASEAAKNHIHPFDENKSECEDNCYKQYRWCQDNFPSNSACFMDLQACLNSCRGGSRYEVVAIFEHIKYLTHGGRFINLAVGEYPDLSAFNFYKIASSIIVPAGHAVDCFADTYFRDHRQRFGADNGVLKIDDLRPQPIGNDQLASLKIFRI